MKTSKKQKIALVLGGGSAFGYAHIGVIKAMEEKGMKPDIILGTSMGSIVGAYYSVFGEVDSLVKVIGDTRAWKMVADPGFFSLGMIKCKRIEDLFKKVFGDKTFRSCGIPLKINGCDINSGKNIVFKSGRIRDAVRASMSVPGIFAPFVKGRQIFVDGGVTNNLMIDEVPKGYKVIAVKVTPSSDKRLFSVEAIKTRNPIKRLRYYFELVNKSFSILIEKLESHLVENHPEVTFLQPDLSKFSYVSFGKHEEIAKAGYEEAIKKL